MAKLIVVGSAGADINVPPHDPPPPGQMITVSSLGMQIGGSGFYTAIVASRLGISTAFAGVLGNDVIGQMVREKLRAERVDVTRLSLLPERYSPITLIYNRSRGDPSYVQHPGTNADYKLPPVLPRVPCRMVHLASPEMFGGLWPNGVVEFVRQLKVNQKTVSVDTFAVGKGAEYNVREHRHLFDLVDIVFTNEHQAKLVSGRSEWESVVRYFLERGVSVVVVKCGPKGAIVASKGRIEKVPPARVKAVDPQGAGDHFVAGFLAGHIRGLDPLASARLGCKLGALCVCYRGVLTGTADAGRLKKVTSVFAASRR